MTERLITIFTPTYNRAHTLPRLYDSLKRQTRMDFEWLVINDGSTDGTTSLLEQWENEDALFAKRFYTVENGGKQRAINKALDLARGEFFFIVDSDDALCENAVSFVIDAFKSLPDDSSFIGVSGIRGDMNGNPLNGEPWIDKKKGFVDCNNIERSLYNLHADMAEAFFTEKLKRYKFPVWDGETFTPEAVVWDSIALDGYKLRWFDKVMYLCDYQPDGLTKGSWRLQKNNPMGYAMLFDVQLKYIKGFRKILNNILLFDCQCFLGGQYSYILKCTYPALAIIIAPLGWMLSKRREKQFDKYVR